MKTSKNSSCTCSGMEAISSDSKSSKKMSAANIIMGGFFILFPKCPFCWAAYASLFSFIGLDKVAYNSNWKWLILSFFLVGSFVLIRRHLLNRAFVNFAMYLLGVVLILISYSINFTQLWWLGTIAIIMILSNLDLQKILSWSYKQKRLA